jgi:hypothetical protein
MQHRELSDRVAERVLGSQVAQLAALLIRPSRPQPALVRVEPAPRPVRRA